MGLNKTVLLLLAVSFVLLASTDGFVTSSESDKSLKTSSSVLHPSSNNLRRGLKSIDADDKEERGITLKDLGGKLQASIAASKARKIAAKTKRLEEIKTAMLNGRLSEFVNNEFAKFFVAGKYVGEVVNTMRAANKPEVEIATFARKYKAWLKKIQKIKLDRVATR
ncbi:hypothetical protein V7S43_007280 [Phytophthora oleae]|uniref:RxLR effector protein n=1 Tax=Phytophthora oleae TaxID=2107226 RepID=A0ABD3FLD9_9STRA